MARLVCVPMNNKTEKTNAAIAKSQDAVKASFTPANWSFTYTEQEKNGLPCVYDDSGWKIAEVNGNDNTNREANARLISCAPEMLAMLEEVFNVIDGVTDEMDARPKSFGDGEIFEDMKHELLGLLAPIEELRIKAKGEATND